MNRTFIAFCLLIQSAFALAQQNTALQSFKEITEAEHLKTHAAARQWCTHVPYCRTAHEALLAYFYTAAQVAAAELAFNEVKANIMRRCKLLDTFADDVRKQEMKALAHDCALIKTITPIKTGHDEKLKRIEDHLESCNDLTQTLEELRDTLFDLIVMFLATRAHELDALLLQTGDVMADEMVNNLAQACRSLAQQPTHGAEDASLMKLNMLNNLLNPLNIKLEEFTTATDALTQAVNFTLVIGRAFFISAYNALSEMYEAAYDTSAHFSFTGDESVQKLPSRL